MNLRERLFGRDTADDDCNICLGMDVDEMFELLRNRRRRQTILAVAAQGETTLDEMARAVARTECIESPVTSDERKSAYVSLYQAHLPKLEEAGVVEWERDHTLTATERTHSLAKLIKRIHKTMRSDR